MLGKTAGQEKRMTVDEMVDSPPDVKIRLFGKDPDAGKDCGQEKRMTVDEMVHGDGERQGSLACCSLWGRKESGTTERATEKQQTSGATTYRFR